MSAATSGEKHPAPHIFVSHSHEDSLFTERLVDDLSRTGAKVWMDKRDAGVGNFVQRISEALDRSDWFVLVLTHNALASRWVRHEVDVALSLKNQNRIREIIVIQAGPVEPHEVPTVWGVFNILDATIDYTGVLARVLAAIGLEIPKEIAQAASASRLYKLEVLPTEVAAPTRRQDGSLYELEVLPTEVAAPPHGQDGSLVGQTLGVYQLRALLSVGGMAEVYLAEDPSLRRDIAVKVMSRSLAVNLNYIERFRNEAQRVARLSHPNIVPVYTFGEERGLLYLVMPRLKESLRERMEREGILSLQEAARVTNQIAAALHIAHQHGIVHRDVKPENILLDETGKAMLTDFGIARELSAQHEAGIARTLEATSLSFDVPDDMARTLAASGLPVGTPKYMAPEQLRGLRATEKVDLYALGVVLYEMLTAHVPYDAATPYEVATSVLRDRLALPSSYNDSIPPEVEWVILKATEKDPEKRYHTMREFAMALREAVAHPSQPIPSGALRWTHYAPVADANSSEASGPTLSKTVALASSKLIIAPQIPLDDKMDQQPPTQEEAQQHRYSAHHRSRRSAFSRRLRDFLAMWLISRSNDSSTHR